MRYHALAIDYDGTLASDGRVGPRSLRALERLKASGRKLILVTGRELADLQPIFPEIALFDRVVAENGGSVFDPAMREEKVIGPPPPPELIAALRDKGVRPLSVGRVLLASWEPFEKTIVQTIRELGLEHHIVFNKGAVMVLPAGLNKAAGLTAALAELGLSAHNVAGIGDGENDHAFLSLCECSAAVSTAVEGLKARVDWVTPGAGGEGAVELMERLIDSDLKELEPKLARHHLRLGKAPDGESLSVAPYGRNVMLHGASGSGKSTLAMGFLERMVEAGYQFCIIDPEGDYGTFEAATTLGSAAAPPQIDAVLDFLKKPGQNLVVNLLAVPMKDRPAFFRGLLSRIEEVQARFGRPHWILIDEAHHLMPSSSAADGSVLKGSQGHFLITVHPHHVAPALLSAVDVLLTVGRSPENGFRAYGEAVGEPVPALDPAELKAEEAWAWFRRAARPPVRFVFEPPKTQKRRHQRKYAEGELPPDRSFYFRGPEDKLNLRAQNLDLFMQLAQGLDDATWLHHLRRGDYSLWFREKIKDAELADAAAAIEKDGGLTARESRARIAAAVKERYTAAP